MNQPQSLNILLGEYTEGYRVWSIQARSGKLLAIREPRFPGRLPIRFFTSEYDASRVMDTVLEIKPAKLEQSQVALPRPSSGRLLWMTVCRKCGHGSAYRP